MLLALTACGKNTAKTKSDKKHLLCHGRFFYGVGAFGPWNGNILVQKKPTYGTIPDAMKAYRFSTVTAPSGTVKAEIQIYGYSSPIYFYGIGIIHK